MNTNITNHELAQLAGMTVSQVNRDVLAMLRETYPHDTNYDDYGVFIFHRKANGISKIDTITLDRAHAEHVIANYKVDARQKVLQRIKERPTSVSGLPPSIVASMAIAELKREKRLANISRRH